MNIKPNKILGITILSLVICISVFSVSCNPQAASQPPVAVPPATAAMAAGNGPSSGENLQFKSIVLVEVYKPVGGSMTKVYEQESSNVITNIGLHVIARQLAGQAATYQWTPALSGNNFWYTNAAITRIGLSTDTTAVDATHASWQNVDGSYPADIEINTGGLARGTGTFTQYVAYTAGAGAVKGSISYTVAATFTVAAGSSFTAIQKAGLFNGVYNTNAGLATATPISALVAENTFAPVDLSAGDMIAVTWRITL